MDITLKPRKNKHLNAKECYLIEALLKVKFKELEIANLLGRHVSTIYREIKRGTVEFRNSDWSMRQEYSAFYSLTIAAYNVISFVTGAAKSHNLPFTLLSYQPRKL